MRQNLKRVGKRSLAIILTVLMVFSTMLVGMVAVNAADDNFVGGETIFLKPSSSWADASAKFGAYFFNPSDSTAAQWVLMTDDDSDGYYSATIPGTCTWANVIFCRLNSTTTATGGTGFPGTKWNQTGDLSGQSGMNCYTVPSGTWDGSTDSGNWSYIATTETLATPTISVDSNEIAYTDGSYVTLTVTNHSDYASAADVTYYLYKDGTQYDTFTSSSYQLTEGGTYTVKAVPGNTDDYSESATSSSVEVTKAVETFTVTAEDPANGSISVSPSTAANGSTVSVTVTPDTNYKCSGITVTKADGTTVTTSGSGNSYTFTMPSSDVTVEATIIAKSQYSVSVSSNDDTMGTVKTSATAVYEGDTVTLTATPSGTNTFKSWTLTGDYTITSGSTSSASLTIEVNSDVTATATFAEDQGTKTSLYLIYGTNGNNPTTLTSSLPIYKLSNGEYVARFETVDTSKSYYFALSSTTSYTGMYWQGATYKNNVSVTSANTELVTASYQNYNYNNTEYNFGYLSFKDSYVDSLVIKVGDDDGNGNIKQPNYVVRPTSSVPDGAIEVWAKDGGTFSGGTNMYGETTITSGTAEGMEGTDKGFYRTYYVPQEGGIITIQTQINSSYITAGYYVYAYVINGETVNTTNIGNGVYESTYSVPANYSGVIEITPVYYNTKIEAAGDYITFYVDAAEIGDLWGNMVACYSYYYMNGTDTSGGTVYGDGAYPGQPMLLNANGKYFTKLARYYYDGSGNKTDYLISGITLNNYYENDIHSGLLSGDAKKNHQTYDYDDFKWLSDSALEYDTIEFDIKYRTKSSNQGLLGVGASAKDLTGTTITTTTFANQNGWDDFVDYDNNKVDILGNEVDDSLKPIYIVSTGNQDTTVGQWSTVWYVFDENGKYITQGNPSDFIRRGNDADNTAQYNTMNTETYLNRPAYICFESFMDATTSNYTNSGFRVDGRWYYKNSKLSQVTVDVQVQYSDDEGTTWSYDTTGTKGTATIDGYTEITYNEANIEASINAIAGNGYMFVEWGLVDDNGENYRTISTLINDVLFVDTNYHLVARFIKIDDESLVISHERYAGPNAVGGYGFYYASVVLYHKDGTTTEFAKTQSAIPVAVNYLTDEKLVITLETVCSGRNTFIDYYEYVNGTYQIIGPEDVDNYGSRTPEPYTFEVSVADICDEYGNLSIQALNYYSDIASVTAKAKLNYKYNNRFNEERTYTVQITLSEEYLTKYPDYSLDNEDGYDLIYKNAPAIDDIYKDCKWQIGDQTVTFNGTTATLWAVQTTKQYDVTINDGINPEQVARVYLNDFIAYDAVYEEIYGTKDTSGIVYYTAPEKNGDAEFSHWLVEEDGREVAKCYSHAFNLRIAGNYTITAIYGTKSESLTISDANYTREQFTDSTGSTTTDYLYADFIVAYMDSNGVLLNGELGTGYKTGLVVEFDKYIKVNVDDVAGGKLTDEQKITFTDEQNLDDATIKSFVESGDSSYVFDPDGDNDKNRVLYNFEIDNANYNNKNRLDFYVRFKNTEANRHYVMKAYYYVIDPAGNYSITEPVYFYLYDIGNSVSVTA